MSWTDNHLVVLRDEGRFSGQCVTGGERKNKLLLEEPVGSMLTSKVHVFSDSVFCTGPGALKAEAVMKSDT